MCERSRIRSRVKSDNRQTRQVIADWAFINKRQGAGRRAIKQHLVEIKGSTLFDEYLQSMGVPGTALDREQDIYLQERHLGAIRRVQGELRFYLRANALNKR